MNNSISNAIAVTVLGILGGTLRADQASGEVSPGPGPSGVPASPRVTGKDWTMWGGTPGRNQVNPFEYLTALQKHANKLSDHPDDWMPWNYRDTLQKETALPPIR